MVAPTEVMLRCSLVEGSINGMMRNSQGASRGEGGNEVGAAVVTRASNTTITWSKEDGSTTGTELLVSSAESAVLMISNEESIPAIRCYVLSKSG